MASIIIRFIKYIDIKVTFRRYGHKLFCICNCGQHDSSLFHNQTLLLICWLSVHVPEERNGFCRPIIKSIDLYIPFLSSPVKFRKKFKIMPVFVYFIHFLPGSPGGLHRPFQPWKSRNIRIFLNFLFSKLWVSWIFCRINFLSFLRRHGLFRREDSKVFAKYHFFVDTASNLC